MKHGSAALVALACCLSCSEAARDQSGGKADERRESAYRANNSGVAFMEQYAYPQAVDAFRRAIDLDGSIHLAHVNLPIALFYAGELDESATTAKSAEGAFPDAPQPPYILGLIARNESRLDDAADRFRRVIQLDPDDVAAQTYLALVYVRQEKYRDAIQLLESAIAREPYNATAAYNLGLALTRVGDRATGQRMLSRFESLRTAAYAVTYSDTYLEQGRYAETIASSGTEPDLVSTADPDVVFSDATEALLDGSATAADPAARPPALGGGVTLADLDGDGDLDVVSAGQGLRVLMNDGARFVDRSAAVGLAGMDDRATGVVAGDFNNDARADLLLLTLDGYRLFAQAEDGSFRPVDIRGRAGAPDSVARAAAFADVDHDGDLDILIGGLAGAPLALPWPPGWGFPGSTRPAASRLLRNNGYGKFDDVTAAAGLAAVSSVVALGATDFDNHRDIDLIVVSHGTRPRLFRNLRDGSFTDVAEAAGFPGVAPYTCLALADVNKDGFTDAFFGRETAAGIWAMSDGRSRFRRETAPAGTEGTRAVQIFDYDNDGLLDLFAITERGARVFRNGGRGWRDQTNRALPAGVQAALQAGNGASAIAAGDVDGDGDTDVVVRTATGGLRILRNDGGSRNRSLRVRLAPRVSNRAGVGAKVEMRAGSLYQKLETAAAAPPVTPADAVFGLGRRGEADTVRVLWPAGTLQSEAVPAQAVEAAGDMRIEELDRKPSSCPYLFAWNGQRFEFVTDFLGGGELGSWLAPGVRNSPDPVEYVRMTSDQLRVHEGRFMLRVTNELEEALFLDHLRLLAVTHPADVQVFPDEGLRAVERPFRLHALRRLRPPRAAWDDHGHDLLPRITNLDRQYPDDFTRLPIRGYAGTHALVLDLPAPATGERARGRQLVLTGWTDYAFSSDNVAAHQAGLSLNPPVLQVPAGSGWRTIDADVGFPVGRPQTIVVNLAAAAGGRVRLVTNMRVYWDQILVGEKAAGPLTIQTVRTSAARLAWRGFSHVVTPDGREPFGYDYERVDSRAPWKLMPGRYTREGNVDELLRVVDDRFVISRAGDELTLSFDASALAPLRADEQRTFLLHSAGFSKEMNLHSASPDRAAPIPFRRMGAYPYVWPVRYPHEADLERFHTRRVAKSIATLNAVTAAGPSPQVPGSRR